MRLKFGNSKLCVTNYMVLTSFFKSYRQYDINLADYSRPLRKYSAMQYNGTVH